MKFENLNSMLHSKKQDEIVNGLMVLYNNPRLECEDWIKQLVNFENSPLIRSLSEKILKKLDLLKQKNESIESARKLDDEFSRLCIDDKLKVLASIKHDSDNLIIPVNRALNLYFMEENAKILLRFADALAKGFPSKIMPLLRQKMESGSEDREKVLLALVCMKNTDYFDEIVNTYKDSTNEAYLFAASLFLWKHSKIVVVSVLKKLAESIDTPLRIITSVICKYIKANELKGIMNHLIEDPNESISSNAKAALSNLKQIDEDIDSHFEAPTEDIQIKFHEILESGTNFQDKLSVLKVINNLDNPGFLEVISNNLKTEENPFLISAYVKYLGKYGNDKYLAQLIEHLTHEDSRVVSNCIEGLGYSTSSEVREIMLMFIKHKHHRIASCAALVLWKNNEKSSVNKFLEIAVKSKKLWKKKSALRILQKISDQQLAPYVDVLVKDRNNEIRESAKKLQERKTEKKSTHEIVVSHLVDTGKLPEKLIDEQMNIITDPITTVTEKTKAIKILSFMVDETHLPRFKALFEDKTVNIEVRIELLKSLAIIVKGPVSFLIKNTSNENFQIRLAALGLLSHHDCSNWVDELFPLLYDDNREIVAKASIILNEFSAKEVEKKIRTMLCSPAKEVKLTALNAVKNIGSHSLFKLAAFLIHDSNTEVIVQASSVVAFLQEKYGYKLPLKKISKTAAKDTVESVVSDEVPEENPVELLVSVSDCTDPSIIEKKINHLMSGLEQQHIPAVLSFMETTTNTILLSKLTMLFSKFYKNKKVIEMAKKCLSHQNSRVVANTIESFIKVEEPLFFHEICKKINDSSDRVRVAIMKLMFQNHIYSHKIADEFVESDLEKFLLTFIPKELMDKYIDSKNSHGDINNKIKKIAPNVQPKEIKEKKSVKKIPPPEKKPVKTIDTLDKTEKIKMAGAGVFLILVILFFGNIFFSSKEVDKDIVSDNVSMPEVNELKKTTDLVKKEEKTVVFEFSDGKVDIGNVAKYWKKISRLDTSSENKKKIYFKSISAMEEEYFRGEFFLVKKYLDENRFKKAFKSLTTVLEHLKKDEVLWDPIKRIWIAENDMENKIFQEVKKKRDNQ